MEKSFSLHFNPLTNVKSVKDYEQEIHKLKTENFDLKSQLTHSNAPSQASNEILKNLETEKSQLLSKIENLKISLEAVNNDKRILENKYNQDIYINTEKIGLLEDENKRLILRMEKFNKEIDDLQRLKNENSSLHNEIMSLQNINNSLKSEFQNESNSLRSALQNLEKQNEQLKYECSKLESRNEAENLQRNYEIEMKNANLMLTDLKNTLSNEIKEKNRILSEFNKAMSELKMKDQIKENEVSKISEICISCSQKEIKTYSLGMERFKSVISNKLSNVCSALQNINKRMESIKSNYTISEEHHKFLERIKAKGNINDIVSAAKAVIIDLNRKNEILRKEAADATFFAQNNKKFTDGKSNVILESLMNQFKEARKELDLCKSYLEKKALENKQLKIENSRLSSEAFKKARQIETAKKMYDGFVNKFGLSTVKMMM
jgi:hypothetical protein